MISKNVTINGRRTSLRLEESIWATVDDICQREGLTIHQLFTLIENRRQGTSRTSAVRTFIVGYLRAMASENGPHRKGIVSSILSEELSGRLSMTKTILIVEDNELNMKLQNDLLQANGYNTLKSVDGKDALSLAREHKPDLIIMDIQLPEVSGLELTKMLKADDALRGIPVLAVTAFVMKGDKEKCFAAGCDGYVAKPISVPHFLDTVKKFIGNPPIVKLASL